MEFKNEVIAFLTAAISDMYGKDADALDSNTRFAADLGMKSVDIVRITAALEDEYEVEVPFMGFNRNKTIGEAAAYVAQLMGLE